MAVESAVETPCVLGILQTTGSVWIKKGKRQKKVEWSHYRPGVAQRVGRGIALLLYDHDTRRGWVVSSTPWPHFAPGKDPVPILQEAGWAPGLVWMGGKSCPHRDSFSDHPSCSQSLYWLSYPAHSEIVIYIISITYVLAGHYSPFGYLCLIVEWWVNCCG
jgi:hypothetical protein